MKTVTLLSGLLFFLSAYICLPAILAVLTVDVVLRFFFNAPLRWGQEFAAILLFLSVVLALPQSWLKHAHVKADFLQHLIGATARALLARLKWLMVLVVSGLIVWQCWDDAQYMLLIGDSTPELYVPLAWLRGALALAAAVSGLVALAGLFSRNPADGEPEEPV